MCYTVLLVLASPNSVLAGACLLTIEWSFPCWLAACWLLCYCLDVNLISAICYLWLLASAVAVR
jgi:hypothetical protein